MNTYTLRFWTKMGPRDQTNCMNGWGRRTATVRADNPEAAVVKLVLLIGRANYGGLCQEVR